MSPKLWRAIAFQCRRPWQGRGWVVIMSPVVWGNGGLGEDSLYLYGAASRRGLGGAVR
jgi:hypothetical protein